MSASYGSRMDDVTITFEHAPGTLAHFGEALGAAAVSVEGGGAWVVDELVVVADQHDVAERVASDWMAGRSA
jgi:hypothetical protein